MANEIIVAIDGYAGCGKSTTAKRVAQGLGYIYVDSGAMYRAMTYHFLQQGLDYNQPEQVAQALMTAEIRFAREATSGLPRTLLNGEDVEDALRTPEVSAHVSPVAAIKAVREALVAQQRAIGSQGGIVMDGRDIGTVVFPNAELKVFMTASIGARVRRRLAEYHSRGITDADEATVRHNLLERDRIDTTRTESPLRQAEDARLLDTTHMTIDEQVRQVVAWAQAVRSRSETISPSER